MLQFQTFCTTCRKADAARFTHMVKEHPYQAFPVERLEAAVAGVPLDNFLPADRQLLGFGSPQWFW